MTFDEWKRRWFPFSLKTLVVFLVIGGIAFGWERKERYRKVQELAGFAGKEIRNLNETERANASRLLYELTSIPRNEDDSHLKLWHVWVSELTDAFLITFEGQVPTRAMLTARFRLTMIDLVGEIIHRQTVFAGRDGIAETTYHEAGQFPYIRIESPPLQFKWSLRWQ